MPTLTGVKDVADKINDEIDDFTKVTGVYPHEINLSVDLYAEYTQYFSHLYSGNSPYFRSLPVTLQHHYPYDTVVCGLIALKNPVTVASQAFSLPLTVMPSEPTSVDLAFDIPKAKCECGKDKHGFAMHSTWCALYSRNGM